MIIADFHIYKYSLPFVRPITMLNQSMTTRDGMLVKLVSKDGLAAFGDVPPFPGLSDESLESAFLQLENVCKNLQGKEIQPDNFNYESALSLSHLYPSVSFGIESALVNIAAQEQNTTTDKFFSKSPHSRIKTNALLSGPAEELAPRAKHLIAAGYSTLKIKVGRNNVDRDIQMVRDIQRAVGRDIILRLDANRAWNMDEAVDFARGVKNSNIEYIEEPLAEPKFLEQFYAETGMPTALDESQNEAWLESPPKGVAAFIIKPGIHGGLFDSIRMIKKAHNVNVKTVISSAFLSAVGLLAAAQPAAAFTHPNDVMGLDTFSWLARDFIVSPIEIKEGRLNISALEKNIQLPKELFNGIH